MPFVPLYELFPDLAARETRSVYILQDSPNGLPAGSYAFLELFCDEDACDCRRVLFSVVPNQRPAPGAAPHVLATLSFGWEDEEFYRRWASFPLDEDDLEELMGPALSSMSPQSKLAPGLLEQLKLLVQDPLYVERIVRHYETFRRAIDAGAKPLSAPSRRRLPPAKRRSPTRGLSMRRGKRK